MQDTKTPYSLLPDCSPQLFVRTVAEAENESRETCLMLILLLQSLRTHLPSVVTVRTD